MANLVFKYSWDHRPYPYNSAQGKRQFMLPFASGIPNLAPDWTQVQGLGNAATGTITTSNSDLTAGRVLKVGDFGVGLPQVISTSVDLNNVGAGFFSIPGIAANSPGAGWLESRLWSNGPTSLMKQFWTAAYTSDIRVRQKTSAGGEFSVWHRFWTEGNTTVDANGFVKSASPIVKLFAESIELNDSAKKQPVEFEKIDVGNYLLKGSLGFAQEGWYIEVPKDANGNTVVAVEYSTLENGDLSIKTYKRKFDFELAAVIADHENPMDIPEERWIDIRLHEEPEPEPEELLSETPVEFQPTNLSEAVAAALAGVEPPEISDTDAIS
ncbi:phage tail protein [Acinetobacter baumannii]|uniref:phage tail fiber protein n=1 Tax=Acinetobacter baumannii TaxID=470 RepID=UPI002F2E65E2